MKTTIVYDNTAFRPDLQADWGFSSLVEVHGRRILFDTGARGEILLANMNALMIDPGSIDDIFISHGDFDHCGGLPVLLERTTNVTVWLPRSYPHAPGATKCVVVDGPRKLYDGLYSTGELANIEQSLCVETRKGIVIIAGCSHPPMERIIETASAFGPLHGIIGGLHGNSPESLTVYTMICATHCTLYKEEIRILYPEKHIEGGAGKVIEI
ncbi:MAG: MBL fold metallo-hydrolase [Spirochaetes bacterium]|nr:MBL fold metallo-hydrolase [Spirochaetota bacterium]